MTFIKSGGLVFGYYIRRKQKICNVHAWSNPGFFYVQFQEVSDTWQAITVKRKYRNVDVFMGEILKNTG
ncbi:MAG: hypothetical protein HFG56_12000 [Lachnospiraceae bacterium]|jgi:hypothetical protein|nr:hypothetical protein [Lachnospiraceae bacterium]